MCPGASGFKLGPQSFTRSGPLCPELLITLLVYMVADGGRRGYRHLLAAFWDDAKAHGLHLPVEDPVSGAAFCNARRKLKAATVRVLLHDTAEAFERQHGASLRFHGRRVFAVDGSKIPVQRADELWRAFGGPSGGHTPQIMVTTLFDVIAKLPVDATVMPYASSEREQLDLLVGRLHSGDVLVLDRGFPSYEVIGALLARKLDFVMRVPAVGSFAAVEDFVRSGRAEGEVTLVPVAPGAARDSGPFVLRAVRRDGLDGEPQVLLTSLPSTPFSHSEIFDLYRRRWEIELFFRLEKGDYIGHSQFHARHADGVRQEVFALLLFVALSRTLMAAAAEARAVPYDRISQKGAILAAAHRFTVLLLDSEPQRARHTLDALLRRIARCLDERRRSRSFPRRSFKPRSRWAASGHAHDPERRAEVG